MRCRASLISVRPSVGRSVGRSVSRSIYPSVHLSVYPPACLPACLSPCMPDRKSVYSFFSYQCTVPRYPSQSSHTSRRRNLPAGGEKVRVKRYSLLIWDSKDVCRSCRRPIKSKLCQLRCQIFPEGRGAVFSHWIPRIYHGRIPLASNRPIYHRSLLNTLRGFECVQIGNPRIYSGH